MSLIVQKFGGSQRERCQAHPQRSRHHRRDLSGGERRDCGPLRPGRHHRRSHCQGGGDQPPRLQAGDGYAALHRRADLCGPVRHGPGGHGPALRIPGCLAGGDTVHLRPLRRPDQEDRHRAYPGRAGPAPDRDRHRLPGRGPQRGRDHPGPGRLRHQRRGAGGGLPGRSVPDLHGCGRCVYHGPPHRPQCPEAGGDHLRRDAGAGVARGPRCSTTAAWSWPRSSE